MTPAGLNICLKHVEEWSGLETLLLLSIIPGSVFCSTCQHSNCVGLAAATVILVSIWCFWAPEDSTAPARSPPNCYHPDCFQVQTDFSVSVPLFLSLTLKLMFPLCFLTTYSRFIEGSSSSFACVVLPHPYPGFCRGTVYEWLKYYSPTFLKSCLLLLAKRMAGLTKLLLSSRRFFLCSNADINWAWVNQWWYLTLAAFHKGSAMFIQMIPLVSYYLQSLNVVVQIYQDEVMDVANISVG